MPHGLAFTLYQGLGVSQKLPFKWRIIVSKRGHGLLKAHLWHQRVVSLANSLTEEELSQILKDD